MMCAEKKRIINAFNRAEKTYDDYCVVQNKSCEKLINFLKKINFDTSVVADFACGTGVSTQYLIESFHCSKIYAVDLADKLLSKAEYKLISLDSRLRGNDKKFILCDFDDRIFEPPLK